MRVSRGPSIDRSLIGRSVWAKRRTAACRAFPVEISIGRTPGGHVSLVRRGAILLHTRVSGTLLFRLLNNNGLCHGVFGVVVGDPRVVVAAAVAVVVVVLLLPV